MKKTIFMTSLIVLVAIISFLPVTASYNIDPLGVNATSNDNIICEEDETIAHSVPDYVKPGDLFFCEYKYKDCQPGWDHVGIYIGDDTFIEANSFCGVWKTNLSVLQRWTNDITYGKVKTANETQRQNAIKFAEGQIGKPYDPYKFYFLPWLTRPKDPSPDAEAWYCSELVWAAYYHQGIDIDRNGDRFPPDVQPIEISSDDDVEMYTYHKLNRYYLGMYIEWLIKSIIDLFN